MYVQSGDKTALIYILIDKTDKDYEAKVQAGRSGEHFFRAQGDNIGTTPVY
jgi:hypothetical protein